MNFWEFLREKMKHELRQTLIYGLPAFIGTITMMAGFFLVVLVKETLRGGLLLAVALLCLAWLVFRGLLNEWARGGDVFGRARWGEDEEAAREAGLRRPSDDRHWRQP